MTASTVVLDQRLSDTNHAPKPLAKSREAERGGEPTDSEPANQVSEMQAAFRFQQSQERWHCESGNVQLLLLTNVAPNNVKQHGLNTRYNIKQHGPYRLEY